MKLQVTTLLPGLLLLVAASPSAAQTTLAVERVFGPGTTAGPIDHPLAVLHAPGQPNRLYVLSEWGQVHILKNGQFLPNPFVDMGYPPGYSWHGLLGMAFHPDFETNGWVFFNHINPSGDTEILRYRVLPGNLDQVSSLSRQVVLTVQQPFFNHNGGHLAFGPDGYLYIGLGDGGSSGDPANRAQDRQQLLGKMLRLDVDNGLPYTIPATNPFVGDPTTLDEIWALGLRNPWRYSFDRATGDLYLGDVGQTTWEEINVEAAGSLGGLNYGWRIMEGGHCFNPAQNCNQTGLELPVFEYGHGNRCSVIAGYVYRGRAMARMHGRFFYGDYCSGEVWSFRYDPATGVITDMHDHSGEFGFLGIIHGFSEDRDGELYVLTPTSAFRLIPGGLALEVPHLTAGTAATFRIGGATPQQPVYLGWSGIGLGALPLPNVGIVVNLEAGHLLAVGAANAAGNESFTMSVPTGAAGRTIWFQAAQPGATSNVVIEEID